VRTDDKPRPANAYELCERACEEIAAHPLNYYQDLFVASRELGGLPTELDVPENECGTAFCRAGWLAYIVDGKVNSPTHAEDRATELLLGPDPGTGLSYDVADLFDPFFDESGHPGTPEYVAQGVRGLRVFMATWEKHLKTTPIPPVEQS
jgi:hypothetical protein